MGFFVQTGKEPTPPRIEKDAARPIKGEKNEREVGGDLRTGRTTA